jgi:hypothetical protein
MPRRGLLVLSAMALLATVLAASPARAVDDPSPGTTAEGVVHLDEEARTKLAVQADPAQVTAARDRMADGEVRAAAVPEVGDVRTWLGLDDVNARYYLKPYTLRGVGEHIEVWVASGSDPTSSGTDFQAGDCRNGPRTQITDEQVHYLIGEFDDTIYPKESAVFSMPRPRSGAVATLPGMVGLPADYYAGQGDRVVTLADNVRDESFFDLNNTQSHSYIAGFFSSQLTRFFDRNVMTIDAFDWLHRTGANPPHEPVPGNSCTSAPARPFLYEGVFAHEYQHLLEHDEDPDERSWVNEGLADWAMTHTGYLDPSVPITDVGFDNHVQCFLGYLGIETSANPIPRRTGGPENSLTLWLDQGDDESLCDYGAASTLMALLAGRYGEAFMGALHREDDNGLAGLSKLVQPHGTTAAGVVHDWAAMVALDGVLDDGARLREGGPARRLRVPALDATINWETPEAYSEPGAPPNGSDYVRLRGADGSPLAAGSLTSLSFDGAGALPAKPVEWTVDPAPPGAPVGGPALRSGSGGNLDRSIVRAVTVPAEDPALTFATSFHLERGWDFGFVQVSTDGGRTWTSQGNADTTLDHDPGAIATVQANLPGFTGTSGGGAAPAWITTSFDLSAYAGQDVLLAFRTVTDVNVNEPGWWVDDVRLGGALLSDGTTLAGWSSPTQVLPTPVSGFTVQLVAYTDDHREAWRTTLTLDENHNAVVAGDVVRRLGDQAQTVAAIVTYDEPTETITQYAPYVLKANGVPQPGGGTGAFLGFEADPRSETG